MKMEKQNNTMRISKKNVMVGLGKSLGVATLGYLVTAGLSAVFSEKTFGEIVIDSLRPGPVRGAFVLGSLALSTYGYAGEDAYKDWIAEEIEYWSN